METSHEHTAPTGAPGGPDVTAELDGDVPRITVVGELTDAARRPLVREVSDLLLARHDLHRIHLELRDVTFVNSAGIAVLVQLHKMVAPRAIELVLLAPTPAVVRPLQLTGLWHRFTVTEEPGGAARGPTGQDPGEHG